MSSTRIIVIIFLALVAVAASSPVGGQHRHRHHHGQRGDNLERTIKLCGRELADFLSQMCSGRGYNDVYGPTTQERKRSGVAEECCHVSCKISDLDKYCKQTTSPQSTVATESEADNSASVVQSDASGNEIRSMSSEPNNPHQTHKHTTTTPQPPPRTNEIDTGENNHLDRTGRVEIGKIWKKYNNAPAYIFRS